MSDKFIYIMIAVLILFLVLYIKPFFKIIINIILGIIFIYLANIILKSTGLYVEINIFTALFSGVLGIPGIICLYILQILL